jgi:hypothetical protein
MHDVRWRTTDRILILKSSRDLSSVPVSFRRRIKLFQHGSPILFGRY